MKFRCKTDQYRQFRGYVFAWGKPTNVIDRASIDALTGHPDFEHVEDAPANGHERPILTLPKRRGRPPKSENVL